MALVEDWVGQSGSAKPTAFARRNPRGSGAQPVGSKHSPSSALSARGILNCNREDLGKRWPT